MNYGRIILLLLLFPASVFTQVDPIPQLITNEEDDYFGTIRWTLPEQEDAITDSPGAHLRVYTRTPEEAISEQWPPVMGGYEVRDHYLYFRPRFPFLTGRSYWVWYNGRVAELQVPEKETLPPPGILDVFPSGAVWPANQLKFYVYFDQPMRTGFAGDYLRLLDEKGNRVEAPFLDMGQELWDREQKRLTVWFDPGRIKSHLIPNQKMGPPLQANRTYQLVIKKGWPAANGEQLQEDHVKNFVTGGKDQEKPQPERWEIQAPVANTRESFILQFHEAMDMAMLRGGIRLLTDQEDPFAGAIHIAEQEHTWKFVPEEPWQPGTYLLRVSGDMEDLAGNNLQRLFDAPVTEGKTSQLLLPYLEFKVEIR